MIETTTVQALAAWVDLAIRVALLIGLILFILSSFSYSYTFKHIDDGKNDIIFNWNKKEKDSND